VHISKSCWKSQTKFLSPLRIFLKRKVDSSPFVKRYAMILACPKQDLFLFLLLSSYSTLSAAQKFQNWFGYYGKVLENEIKGTAGEDYNDCSLNYTLYNKYRIVNPSTYCYQGIYEPDGCKVRNIILTKQFMIACWAAYFQTNSTILPAHKFCSV